MRMFGSPPTSRCCSPVGRWKAFTGAWFRMPSTQSANQAAQPIAYIAAPISWPGTRAGSSGGGGPSHRDTRSRRRPAPPSRGAGRSVAAGSDWCRARCAASCPAAASGSRGSRSSRPARILDLGVVQMPGAAGDVVLGGEVLVLGREAQVVDAAAPAADAIGVPARDRRPEVVVVGVVEAHLHELGHGAEDRMQRARLLAEGLRARAQQAQQVAVALGAVEARAGEVVAQDACRRPS